MSYLNVTFNYFWLFTTDWFLSQYRMHVLYVADIVWPYKIQATVGRAWQDTDKMASIRRTDIMQKKYPKIRPGKSERERLYKRHEAFRWRDTRRVFLAGSFDRWRKLRSALKLKDSSLAWHLMEAHEKGHCTLCRWVERSSKNFLCFEVSAAI